MDTGIQHRAYELKIMAGFTNEGGGWEHRDDNTNLRGGRRLCQTCWLNWSGCESMTSMSLATKWSWPRRGQRARFPRSHGRV
jgi:hypothetical protein